MTGLKITACLAALALAACGESSVTTPLEDTSDVMTATESSRDFGNWSAYVNAMVTDQLSAEIASNYGITRSSSRAMLNVSVVSNESGAGLPAEVTASATNLSGQLRNLMMRPIEEDTAIYYIGETAITNGETLIFTINITPEGEGTQSLRYMQQFFVD
jgi:hypothetical protein